MRDTERFSSLIGDIYDAALAPDLWVEVLGKVARFVGGPAAALWSKDAASKTGNAAFVCGFDLGYTQAYLDEFITLDPANTVHFFAGLEEPVAQASLIPEDEFRSSRFYREWARPQGLVDCVNVTLDKSATSIALFGVSRHALDGVADDETGRRMRLLAPHVRRAMLVGKAIDLRTAEAATFADTLDGLAAGMFLVDGGGRLVHANTAGHAMLAAADFLRAASGRLFAGDPQIDQALRDIFANAGSGDAAIGLTGIAVPLMARGGERYVAHVLPLTSGARRRAGASHSAVAALFVHRAALETPSPPEVIAKTYRLTPTELRVLLAIVEVGGVSAVAEVLGIANTTVKTHLAGLYEKTGARRHADLVRLVAAFSNPLLGR